MWEALENMFQCPTLLNELSPTRRFYTAAMQRDEEMINYKNGVRPLATTFKSMNVEVDDSELAMACLNGLPSTYENVIVFSDALGDDDQRFIFALVQNNLLQEEQRSIEQDTYGHENSSSALLGVNDKQDDKRSHHRG